MRRKGREQASVNSACVLSTREISLEDGFLVTFFQPPPTKNHRADDESEMLRFFSIIKWIGFPEF